MLLFGADIKLAGSLSLAVSLPTMIVGFTRYSRDSAFAVVKRNKSFIVIMALGSIAGTFIGGRLLGIVSDQLLIPALSLIPRGVVGESLAPRVNRRPNGNSPHALARPP